MNRNPFERNRRRRRSFGAASVLVLLLSAPSSGLPDERIPFEIPFPREATLKEVGDQYGIPIETLETLNPSLWGRPDRVILVDQPRNPEEAVLLLEEAKRVELLGGLGVRKAKVIYEGILRAARLLPTESDPPIAVEMPSDIVAQSLLGWGKIHEGAENGQAEWAYHQVRLFFPDRQEYFSKAAARLKVIEGGEDDSEAPETSTGLEWFPFSPHLIIDIDAERLAGQLRRLDPPAAFENLAEHPDERVRKRRERGKNRFNEILDILDCLHSIHIGGWVDPEIYGYDPEEGLQESQWVVVGRLRIPYADFVDNLGIPDATGERLGYTLHDLGRGTHLASWGEHILVAKEQTLLDLIDHTPPFDHPHLSSPESAYQRAKTESGAGSSIFAYFDLEGFLRGPALAFARRGDVDDEEAVAISLILSGVIGMNSIQGLFLSLDYDRDELAAKLGLRHRNEGLLTLFTGPPCPTRTLQYFPQEIQGLLQILRPCTPAVEALLHLDFDRILGLAGPVYRAHYAAWVDQFETGLGARLDPLALLKSGVLNEISLGVQLPGGMVPIPNLLLAAPVSRSTEEFREMERIFTREGEHPFIEEKAGNHWLRHVLIPIDAPLFLDLSYTLHQGTLLVSNNPDLIRQAVRSAEGGERFETDADFREFREEWLPSHHLSLYLSGELTSRLSQWSRASASSRMGAPEKEPFLRVIQSEFDAIARNPHASGLGIRLADKAMVASVRFRLFRSWLNAFLATRWARVLDEAPTEN